LHVADVSRPPPQITVYYWPRGFVLLAKSFVLDRRQHPYRRLSATLMFSLKGSFTLETGEGDVVTAQAVLIAPKVARRHIEALGCDLVICDLAVTTPEFQALSPLLHVDGVCVLDETLLLGLRADFEQALCGALAPAEMQSLLAKTIHALSGRRPQLPTLHPRITQVLQLIQEWPLPVSSLERLALQVNLSTSRLRHLFSEQMGSSLSQYLRWSAVWKGVWLFSRGRPLIDVAIAVGFHDLAHLNRAFNEVFGLNPSLVVNPSQIRLVKCEWS